MAARNFLGTDGWTTLQFRECADVGLEWWNWPKRFMMRKNGGQILPVKVKNRLWRKPGINGSLRVVSRLEREEGNAYSCLISIELQKLSSRRKGREQRLTVVVVISITLWDKVATTASALQFLREIPWAAEACFKGREQRACSFSHFLLPHLKHLLNEEPLRISNVGRVIWNVT